jgi:ADP-ribose pyrophosphatase YjhB (NUDIX family)
MCRRAQEPSRGLWTIPAGFMEEGETVEQTAARETEEETGVKIDCDRLDLYAVLSLPDINEVYLTLRAELPRVPDFATGSESLEVALRGENEIGREDWAFSSILVEDTAATLFRELRTGSFGIHKIRFGKQLTPPYETRTYGIRTPQA